MGTADLIERSRIEVQKNIDSKKLHEARRKMGQFATPTALANEMLQYACAILNSEEIRFLDPAFGTGVFYSALLNTFAFHSIQKAEGFEIDQIYWNAAMDLWNHEPPLRLQLADFTRLPTPKTESDKFNLIICNPPYVRHHAMATDEKLRLMDLVTKTIGIRPSGYSGLYCYFLMLSHNWMSRDGVAGWLIPSEFMDVNYGRQVKEFLLNKVTLLRIHRFDPSQVQFNDALVSSAVVWIKNTIPPSNHTVEFSYGGTLLKPSISRDIPIEKLRGLHKWSGFPISTYEKPQTTAKETLEDFFTIKRGVATGANNFFVLTKERAEELQIPTQFLKPVLPPPRNLEISRIESDKKGNPIVEQKLFLLSCDLPEANVKKEYPTLWKYLLEGKKEKINERYICKHRSPWYSQENRPPAAFLFNIIGRPDNSKRKSYRFILNTSQATATNNYLMLYPKTSLQKLLDQNPTLREEAWIVLNSIPLCDLLKEGRVYGGGLYKIEPKELRRVSSSQLTLLMSKYQKTTAFLRTLEDHK